MLQVYERGIGLFKWPFVFDVYIMYINKFVARYVCQVLFTVAGRADHTYRIAVSCRGGQSSSVREIYLNSPLMAALQNTPRCVCAELSVQRTPQYSLFACISHASDVLITGHLHGVCAP